MRDVLSGEFENYREVRASHLTGQTHSWAKPKPLYKQKERTNRFYSRNVLSFSVGIK